MCVFRRTKNEDRQIGGEGGGIEVGEGTGECSVENAVV